MNGKEIGELSDMIANIKEKTRGYPASDNPENKHKSDETKADINKNVDPESLKISLQKQWHDRERFQSSDLIEEITSKAGKVQFTRSTIREARMCWPGSRFT
ncbi:uncharacterized protein ACN427_000880 [Glossina fuscipes fuscipes]